MKRLILLSVICALCFLVSCSDGSGGTAVYSSGEYSLYMEAGHVVADVPWVVNIEKTGNEDFVILNLTDIQLGTNAYELEWDELSEKIDKAVSQTDPDMIMVTGDISYGCGPAFLGICSHIDGYGIPWAPVFGNHDCEDSGMSPDMQVKVLEHFSNCLFRRGPENLAVDGKYGFEQQGNYVINIISRNGDSFDLIRSFVMINSGTGGVTEIQRKWYTDCALSAGDSGVGVVMHIPTDGFAAAAKAAFRYYRYGISLEASYTDDVWNEGYESSFGVQHEGISYYGSAPFRVVAEETGNTDFFLCGHNHCNCTCIEHRGITYVFSLKTGPGCYYEEGVEGCTRLTVGSDGSIKTEHIFF